MKIDWQIKHFSELSTAEFHDLMQLRIGVFVVEQNCAYLELDGKDKKSYHLICRDGLGKIIATARILPQGLSYPEISIGRVVVDESFRGTGKGHELMDFVMHFCHDEFGLVPIRISAQTHLVPFYEQHGFETTGKAYLEDGIPHSEMLFTPIKTKI